VKITLIRREISIAGYFCLMRWAWTGRPAYSQTRRGDEAVPGPSPVALTTRTAALEFSVPESPAPLVQDLLRDDLEVGH
jgi:hypothetical protein